MSDINELATALNAFQAEVVTVGKGKDNPFFKSKYAPLEAIMQAALPVLTKHGLAVSQLISHIEGHSALTTVLMHTSGQRIESTMPLLLAKDDPQGQGSAITYARRYSYAAVLGIVIDEDDDGNKATTSRQEKGAATYPSRPLTGKITEPQVKLLMVKARDASGLTAREDVIAWFHDNYGSPTEVLKSDMDRILSELQSMAKDQPTRTPGA